MDEQQQSSFQSDYPSKQQQDTTSSKMPKSGGKGLGFWIIILVLIALGAVGAWYVIVGGTEFFGASQQSETESGPVAIVNGEEISRAEFNERLAQTQASSSNGQNQEQLELQVVDVLVAETLILQDAEASGISVSEEEIDTQFSQTRSQFPDEDAFQEALAAQGLSEEAFRTSIARQLTIQKYLEENLNLSSLEATNQEVQDLYDQASAQTENAPALETVRGQIETQVIQGKQQQLIGDLVEQLQSEGEVEILL